MTTSRSSPTPARTPSRSWPRTPSCDGTPSWPGSRGCCSPRARGVPRARLSWREGSPYPPRDAHHRRQRRGRSLVAPRRGPRPGRPPDRVRGGPLLPARPRGSARRRHPRARPLRRLRRPRPRGREPGCRRVVLVDSGPRCRHLPSGPTSTPLDHATVRARPRTAPRGPPGGPARRHPYDLVLLRPALHLAEDGPRGRARFARRAAAGSAPARVRGGRAGRPAGRRSRPVARGPRPVSTTTVTARPPCGWPNPRPTRSSREPAPPGRHVRPGLARLGTRRCAVRVPRLLRPRDQRPRRRRTRAAALFDEVVVAVVHNPSKPGSFGGRRALGLAAGDARPRPARRRVGSGRRGAGRPLVDVLPADRRRLRGQGPARGHRRRLRACRWRS